MHTFIFTDIESSMRLWDTDPAGMSRALAKHDLVLRQAIEANRGQIFATMGDGFGAVFGSTEAAIRAAVATQVRLAACNEEGPRLQVRVGIHAGPAEERDGNFYGPTVNQCARLTAAAYGGQILVSEEAVAATDTEVDIMDLGEFRLRDVPRPMRVFQVLQPVEAGTLELCG